MTASTLGLDLQTQKPRECGACGERGLLSKAHVPPQAAGNTGEAALRAPLRFDKGVLGPGRFTFGGMWVRGLCAKCNTLAGSRKDKAYAEFARRVRTAMRGIPSVHGSVPPVTVAPGLVARSVLFGMLAISPTIRIQHPELAAALAAGQTKIRLPPELHLRFALYEGSATRLAGPTHSYKVLGKAQKYLVVAEFYFPPFAWALTIDEPDQFFDDEGWVTTDDWSEYEDDIGGIDLRMLMPSIPVTKGRGPTADQWIELSSDLISTALVGIIKQ